MDYKRLNKLMSERSTLLHLSTCYSRGETYCEAKRAEADAKHEEIITLWVQQLEDRRPPVAQEIQVSGEDGSVERYILRAYNGKEARYVKIMAYRPGPYSIQPLSFEAHIRQQIKREQPEL